MEEGAWDKIFEINVKAGFLLSKEVLPYLRQRGGGSIVYISSIAGYQPLGVSLKSILEKKMYVKFSFKFRSVQ